MVSYLGEGGLAMKALEAPSPRDLFAKKKNEINSAWPISAPLTHIRDAEELFDVEAESRFFPHEQVAFLR
jgi:hypothetical protein